MRLITNKIVVHHSVTNPDHGREKTLQIIENSHRKRGLLNRQGRAAYHVVIGKDWQALTRPENSVGYHSGRWWTNRTSLAVCLVGNFNNDELTEYQEQKLADQLNNWSNQYKIKPKNVLLHRAIKPTACPGANITDAYIKSLLVKPEEKINVRELFKQIWGVAPARGDELYFITRFAQGKVGSRQEMIDDMTGWYKVVYPKGRFSESGNASWQKEKEKVLNGG